MKYLKTYNESFEISNLEHCYKDHGDVIDIIKDRLIELDDRGFDIGVSCSNKVNVKSNIHSKVICVRIKGHKSPNRFFIHEILSDILPLISHLNNEYSLGVKLCHDTRYHDMVKIIGKTHIEQLENMKYQPVAGIELDFYKRKEDRVNETIIVPNELEGRIKEISDNISDICLDISDNGYSIINNFLYDEGSTYDGNSIHIKREDRGLFNSKYIYDTIIRINEYLSTEGFHIELITTSMNGYISDEQLTFEDFVKVKDVNNTTKVVQIYISSIKTNESLEYYAGVANGTAYKYEWSLPKSPIRSEINANLMDILLEVKDLGYGAHVGWVTPHVWIGRKLFSKLKFDTEVVNDTVERVKDYLISEGFEVKESVIQSTHTGNITEINIYFSK